MVQQHLVILLVKLAVAASLASLLTRSARFQQMLMREERTLPQRVQMAIVCGVIYGAGVATRVLTHDSYQAVDLGLEGSIAIGMLGGYVAGRRATLFATALPIKIWNSSRNEKKLEQQQLHLNEARLAALSRQINPHFLFNTLNSIASLIRLDPELARQVIYKLSKILRRLLRQQENLTTLRDGLSFIDDYLAIEMVRLGEKLRFVKEIDPESLRMLVPSMLMHPVVEN